MKTKEERGKWMSLQTKEVRVNEKVKINKSAWLHASDAVKYIQTRFDYFVSIRTLNRWRKIKPLGLPCRAADLFEWFEAVMKEVRRQARAKRQARRKSLFIDAVVENQPFNGQKSAIEKPASGSAPDVLDSPLGPVHIFR